MRKIFVGRQKQLDDFNLSLSWIKGETKPTSIFKDIQDTDLSFPPLVYLLYGEGGLGKSSLVSQFLDLTKSVEDVEIITINLDEDYSHVSISTREEIVKLIYTSCINKSNRVKKFFDSFAKINEDITKLKEISGKAIDRENHLQELKQIKSGLFNDAELLISSVSESQAPGSGIPAKIGLETLDKAFNYIIDNLGEKWLKKQRIKLTQKLDSYRYPLNTLTDELIDCFRKMGNSFSILFIIDGYERISSMPELDKWMRKILNGIYSPPLKELNIISVISGRDNLYSDYRNELPEGLIYKFNADDERFTSNEIKSFFALNKFNLSEVEAAKIREITLGIPLVVHETINFVKDNGLSIEKALNELDATTSDSAERIIGKTVKRFLKHCSDLELKSKIYQISMVDEGSSKLEALSYSWKTDTIETEKIINELSENHSFLNGMKVHSLVKHFLFEHFRTQLLNNQLEGPRIRHLAMELYNYYKNETEQFDLPLEAINNKYSDERYRILVKNKINTLKLGNPNELVKILPGLLLELMVFNYGFARALVESINPFIDTFSSPLKLEYHSLSNQFESTSPIRIPMNFPFFVPSNGYFELLEAANRRVSNLNKIQNHILDFLWALGYYKNSEFEKSVKKLRYSKNEHRWSKEINRTKRTLLFSLGREFDNLSRFEDAIYCYKEIIETAENAFDSNDALHRLGHIFSNEEFDKKNLDKAISYFLKAKEYGDTQLICLANVCKESQKYDLMINVLKEAIDIGNSTASFNLSQYYFEKKDYEKTEEYAWTTIRKTNDSGGYVILGYIQEHIKNDLEKAIEFYKEVTPQGLSFHFANHRLGHIYEKDPSTYELAEKHYLIAIEKNNEYKNGIGCYFSFLIKKKEDYPEAEKILDRMVQNSKSTYKSYLNIGWCKFLIKDLEESIRYSKLALGKSPDSFIPTCNISLAQLCLGNKVEALELYKESLKMEKTSKEIDSIIEDLIYAKHIYAGIDIDPIQSLFSNL